MRTVTKYEIFKQVKNPGGVPYPGEPWDGPWRTEREAREMLADPDHYGNDPAFRVVKITYEMLPK